MNSYPEQMRLDPIRALAGVMDLPGSKSITNRALLLAALTAPDVLGLTVHPSFTFEEILP